MLIAHASLFLSAFVSATLFPGGSEALLVGLMVSGDYAVAGLVLVATLGNVLGSVVNWGLGRWLVQFQDRRWFPLSAAKLLRAQQWYQHYGKWSLLLSWVPIIGDPLTVAAGIMRERFLVFLLLVTLAKFGRYLAIVLVTTEITS
ncbi:MAG: YqaA family protein [Burkholderiaceae bacterium]|jgi:membrane protein YqaA with SNARE-associated domain